MGRRSCGRECFRQQYSSKEVQQGDGNPGDKVRVPMSPKNGPALATSLSHSSSAGSSLWEIQPLGKHRDGFQRAEAEAMGQ